MSLSIPSTEDTMSLSIPSTEDMPQCTMCSSRTSELCPGCQSARYCSKTCMKADLPVHKLLCGVTRPGPNYAAYGGHQPAHPIFQGLLFPVNERKPQWVSYKGNYLPGTGYNYQRHQVYPNPPHPATQHHCHLGSPLAITGNALRSRSRGLDKIKLYGTTNRPNANYELNQSVLSVTYRRPGRGWYGPLIAVKVSLAETSVTNGPQYRDMDMVDFRDIVDHLCTHPAININEMTNSIAATVATPKLEVSVIRINCAGDQALGRRQFEQVQLRIDHPACRAPVTAISRLIRFPVRVSRCLPPHETGVYAASHDVVNLAATDLNMGVNPLSDWGFVGLEWVDPAGSVFVVRDGGMELHPQHVEALCHWCLYVLRPLFQDSMGMGSDPVNPMEKKMVLARVEKREWQCFYRGFDEWMGAGERPWTKGMFPS